MSGLSLLANYSSGSDDDTEHEYNSKRIKLENTRQRLPLPSIFSTKNTTEAHVDDPDEHLGRVRTFPHERGNWSTFVYVPYKTSNSFLKFVERLQQDCQRVESFHIVEEFHISVTRTLIFKFHWINTFVSSLRTSLQDIKRFPIIFDSLDVYTNEDDTRTFLGLKVGQIGFDDLKVIVSKTDLLLEEFNLPVFYKDPSFHISLLWCVGNKRKEIVSLIPHLQNIFEEYTKTFILEEDNFVELEADTLICKSGNKAFNFSLL